MKILVLLAVALVSTLACAAQPGQPAKTLWVYKNGKFNWSGDWSFGVNSVNYRDTDGVPPEGGFDLAMDVYKWGAWQPFVNAECQSNRKLCFDTAPYKFLTFLTKSTVSHQVFEVGFNSPGDKTNGSIIMVTQYCAGGAQPEVGKWQLCKIPLASFKMTETTILKFFIQDETGLAANKWYLDAVGFTVD
jgi:hypothetical protein